MLRGFGGLGLGLQGCRVEASVVLWLRVYCGLEHTTVKSAAVGRFSTETLNREGFGLINWPMARPLTPKTATSCPQIFKLKPEV